MKDLKIIPVPDPRLVPRYLLEQVKGRKWTPEEWYMYQLKAVGYDANVVLSIINEEHKIVGIIWLMVDNLDKCIFINTLSVDKKYQRKSRLIKFVGNYIKELSEKLKIDDVCWIASRTKALERYGFSLSEFKIMQAKASTYGKSTTKKARHNEQRTEGSVPTDTPRSKLATSGGSRKHTKATRSRSGKSAVPARGRRSCKGAVQKPDATVNHSVDEQHGS